MNASIFCPSCSQAIVADSEGRMPPWCRHCGADVKFGEPKTAKSAVGADKTTTAEFAEERGERPSAELRDLRGSPEFLPVNGDTPSLPHIHACEPGFLGNNSLCRIYFTQTDLLVFRIGSGTFSAGQILPPRKFQVLPLGLGLLAASAYREARQRELDQLRLAERAAELDTADEPTLRDSALAGNAAFVAGAGDISWLRIDPPSGYIRVLCRIDHEGLLKFEHRTVGKMKLALPSWKDVRRAVAELPKIFGSLVEVNLSWGSAARRSAEL